MIKEKKLFIFLFFVPLILFLSIFDYKILDPNYLDWFKEDTFQHWLGWSFFRETSVFQFPILNNYAFGMNSSGSLIFSDSIPFLALLFRPFSEFFDFHFQYFGWWILLCVFLQFIISYKIINLVSTSKIYNLIAACFFILSPVFLFRYNMGHESLMAQWIVLIALYLFLQKPRSPNKYWLLLILFSLLVHGYFFAMLSIIYFVEMLRNYFLDKARLKNILYSFVTLLTSSFFLMYLIGYFTIDDVFHGGYGGYRLNLLSIFNPYGSPFGIESLIPQFYFFEKTKNIGDFEGFNYLGAGMIFMLIVLLFNKIINFNTNSIVKSLKNNYFTILIIFIITIYSLSNKIALGPYEIFQYNLPEIFKVFTSPFRASGRMFWPAYYLIYILILFNIFKSFHVKYAISIILFSLLLTTYDIKDHITLTRASKGIEISKIEEKNFNSNEWKIFASKYKHINYVFPVHVPHNWQQLSYFAAKNKLNINAGYWARHNEIAERKYTEETKIRIESNVYDKNTLYFFNDIDYWILAKEKNELGKNLVKEFIIQKCIFGQNECNFRILPPNYLEKHEDAITK